MKTPEVTSDNEKSKKAKTKKGNQYHEKSKHSVQSNSATLQKYGTSPRLPCGRRCPRTPPGKGRAGWCRFAHPPGGTLNLGVSASVHYPRTRDHFRKRDP